MGILDAIILGIIQGLTEFLPVSSSGHLEIAKVVLGQELAAEDSMMMTVVLHFATALSTIIVFRKEVFQIIRGLLQFKANDEFWFSVKIILSMIPAALVGVFLDDIIEQFFDSNILFVGTMLILTGILLFLANRAKNTNKDVSMSDAVVIGIAQAIAILPGISRSGATIGTSVLLGNDKEKAARFSFLMVVPLILGKVAKDLLDGGFETQSISIGTLSVGFITALITGIVACTWMISIVKKSKLSYFSIYCFIVGLIAISWSIFS